MKFHITPVASACQAWACLASSLVVASCSLVPGSYLGVAPTISETDRDYVYDTSGAEDVHERADIFSITPKTILELAAKRKAVEENSLRLRASLKAEQSPGYEYRVGSRDILRVTVWNHPELNNPSGVQNIQLAGRVVNQDGTFFYPYAGNVVAAGRTVQEIRDDLAKKLSKFLVEPQVDVSVLTYRSQKVVLVGQVGKPGVLPVTDVPLTISDLIAQGEGLTPEADLRGATLIRNGKSQPVDLYALFYEGDLSQNITVRDGDVLTIPENRYKKVFVLGEVSKPQSVVMPRGRLSLAEAIADAGGLNPLTSNAGQLYVIRSGANNRPQIWHLDASSPDALVLADSFDLEPRDVVYVDPAGVARFGRVVSNIIPTASVLRATVQN